ncbi:MAG TPA: sugar phosphate nucleotidyltransferase [Chloroflexota bacterium]|jgi:glucose-1-phosphate thymidylyltransferase
MQVVILLAGLGTRLRPHTLTRPKPMLEVAGRPIVEHIVDELKGLPVDEIVFIYGHLKEQFEGWAAERCPFPYRFVEQRELRGQAHALSLVRDHVDRPLLIIFGDTIFEADLAGLPGLDADGMLFVREVEDPRRFGVAVLDQSGLVRRLVEKPKEPVSNLAVVGIYFVRDSAALFRAIDEVIAGGKHLGGEFYLADALQAMIEHGARFRTGETPVWADCGTIEAVLDTNAFLLQHGHARPPPSLGPGVTLVPPVHVDPSATLEGSTVGPNVAIGPGAHVIGSTLRDSIVYRDARIENSQLHRSLIGARAHVRGVRGRANLSEYSEVRGE